MPQLSDMLKKVSLSGSKNSLTLPSRRNGISNSAASTPIRKISLPLQNVDEEAEAAFTSPDFHREVFQPASRLAKSLEQVLSDDVARAHFCQYLEARDAVNFVRFWEEVVAFKSSADPVLSATAAAAAPTPSSPCTPAGHDDSSVESDLSSSFSVFATPSSAPHSPSSAAAARGANDVKTRSSTDSFDSGYHQAASKDDGKPEQQRTRTGDAVTVYTRFIAPDCPQPILLSSDTIHDIVQGICTDSGSVEERCFDAAFDQVLKTLDAEYFRDFLRSESYAKYQVDVLTSGGPMQMSSILYNDALLFNFMEFMEETGNGGSGSFSSDRDLLEFWLAASNFRENSSSNTDQVKGDALVIYEKFISLQATSPLGLSANLRSRVEESICSSGGVVTLKCFDSALVLVVRVLQQRYLAIFLNSNLYRKYLSELFSQIQTGPYKSGSGSSSGGGRKTSRRAFGQLRRTGSNTSLSTCSSSEVSGSISTQNTLLAMSRSKSTILNSSVTSTMLEEDPDSIWRRPSSFAAASGNIGHIDSLGRYRSHFEAAPPDPNSSDKSSAAAAIGSKLSKAMKRLVSNGDIDRVQEELAWQMAERIVKDVTDVTMMHTSSSGQQPPKR